MRLLSTLSEPVHPHAGTPLVTPCYVADDLEPIAEVGSVFAEVLSDIAFHEISYPGCWDTYGTPDEEVTRLRDVLDRMSAVIRSTRVELNRVERTARRRAARTPADQSVIGQGWSPCR